MKRYASIDFLRGFAIFMMLILHTISDVLNVAYLTGEVFSDVPMLNLVLLISLPYLGGLAGFFLMVSSIGNMISMQKFLKKGRSYIELIKRQVIAGFLLIVFAHLVEGPLGYWGSIGRIFRHLDNIDPEDLKAAALSHAFHFETIHTIGWCVLVNGLTHGILVKIYGMENERKIMRAYAVLAVIVLVLTPFAWIFVEQVMPGIEWGQNYPYVGRSPFSYIIKMFLLAPLGGFPEPVFPYLAASYMGSIFGIYITRDRNEITSKGLKFYSRIAWITFLIGTIGLVAIFVFLMSNGIDALGIYPKIWDHRNYFGALADTPYNHIRYWGWIFQFLSLNGFGLGVIVGTMRLVEFRGKGAEFARKTVAIRRFGFVAFTMYCIQFVYHFWHYILTLILSKAGAVVYGQQVEPYSTLSWSWTMLNVLLCLGTLHLINKQWEKIGYIGSLEWMIATIASYLIPGKKIDKNSGKKLKWYERGKLDVEGSFYNAEWMNFRESSELDHENFEESRRALRLSRYGFIFFAIPFMVWGIIKNAEPLEGDNDLLKKAKIISYVQFVMWLIILIVLLVLPVGILGL